MDEFVFVAGRAAGALAEPEPIMQAGQRFGYPPVGPTEHMHHAGTSTIRTSVASTSTATVSPNPNSRMNDTCAAIKAAKEMAMISAAAVITRPVWAAPSTTLLSLAPQPRCDASQYSLIREMSHSRWRSCLK
jgi:hypothetical protein